MHKKLNDKWLYFFDAVPLSTVVALTLFSTSVMALLLLGYLTSAAVLFLPVPLAVVGFILSCRLFVKTRKKVEPLTRAENLANVAILVGALAWGVFNMFYVSQHVFINRDPGIYIVTAEWVTNNDNLNIPAQDSENVNIVNNSAGFEFNPTDSRYLNAQGQHLLPVLTGLSARVFGTSMLFFTNILFGMTAILALFAFSKNFVKPSWALLVSGVMAFSMPFLYFSRDSYTELLALTFIFGGLALMQYIQKNDSNSKLWLLCGLTIGASTLARIDSYLVWIAVIVFVGINIHNALSKGGVGKKTISKNILFLLGAFTVTLIGWLDLTKLSAGYYQDIRALFMNIVIGLIVVVAATTITVATLQTNWFKKVVNRISKVWIKNFVYASILIFFGVLLLRPWLLGLNLPEILQTLLDKLAMDKTEVGRASASYSAQWPLWYFGVVILLGFIGIALRSRSIIEKKISQNPAEVASLVLILAVMAIYFVKPSIAPDHVWASRRQLPIIMPALVVFTVFVVSNLFNKIAKKFNRTAKAVFGLVIIIILLASPITISKPMLFVRQDTRWSAIDEICRTLGSEASVLWFGRAGPELTMSTRAFCNSESFSTKGASLKSNKYRNISEAMLQDFVIQSLRRELKPFIGGYTAQASSLEEITDELASSERTDISNKSYRLERIITSPPQKIVTSYTEIVLFDLSNYKNNQEVSAKSAFTGL